MNDHQPTDTALALDSHTNAALPGELNLTPPVASKPSRPRSPGRDSSPVISFRLEDEDWQRLLERAHQLQSSHHGLARHYTELALGATEDRLEFAVLRLAEMVAALQQDLAAVTEVLLTHGGKVNEKQAADWVNRNLRTLCSPSPTP